MSQLQPTRGSACGIPPPMENQQPFQPRAVNNLFESPSLSPSSTLSKLCVIGKNHHPLTSDPFSKQGQKSGDKTVAAIRVKRGWSAVGSQVHQDKVANNRSTRGRPRPNKKTGWRRFRFCFVMLTVHVSLEKDKIM